MVYAINETTAKTAVGLVETWVLAPEHLETLYKNSALGDVIIYACGDLADECYPYTDGCGERRDRAVETRELAKKLNAPGMP